MCGLEWQPAGADPGVGDDGDRSAIQVVGERVEVGGQDGAQRGGPFVGSTDEYHAWSNHRRVGQQLPEIGVSGDQDPLISSGDGIETSPIMAVTARLRTRGVRRFRIFPPPRPVSVAHGPAVMKLRINAGARGVLRRPACDPR